tara:strand:+ start:2040 stop:3560 length:1521 start_codon:yes stop_codon:yes gene_type:complete
MIIINGQTFTIDDFALLFSRPQKVRVSSDIRKKVEQSHNLLGQHLDAGEAIYGVNTGFGALSEHRIEESELKQLQLNLIRSHCAGTGRPIDVGVTRAIILLKLINFSHGYSGVRWRVVQQLCDFFNHDIMPVIPSQGSVGASGDLVPLSHLSLALIGEGEVHFNDRVIPTMLALRETGIEPLELGPKEGLGLVNGTQVSTAFAVLGLHRMEKILKTADIIGAMTVEATLSSRKVFNPKIHNLKKHPGQRKSAGNIWRILTRSQIVGSHKECGIVQDPYSLRCMPHVHGASRELFASMKKIVENEINSVSDNPLVLSARDGIVYSGHFHGEVIGQAVDSLAIAAVELGGISERRIFRMMEGIEGKVPKFLAHNPGLESGFMMAQVSAAALASENKTQAFPASVDSIPTESNQEDFVAMSPWAGRKLLRILKNVTHILGIELMVAVQMLDLHKPLKPATVTALVKALVRRHIKFARGDRVLSHDMEKAAELVVGGRLIAVVESKIRLE